MRNPVRDRKFNRELTMEISAHGLEKGCLM
jgi:hypothetical protein